MVHYRALFKDLLQTAAEKVHDAVHPDHDHPVGTTRRH
jgi:hypothetical protein